jgi:hypothetical protein
MSAGTVAGDNLIAWWKMDDNVASTVVLDSSGNGYNGTTSQSNTEDLHVAGKIDGAFRFDGGNESIDTGYQFNDIFQNSFTMSFWISSSTGQPSSFQPLITGLSDGSSTVFTTIEINGRIRANYQTEITLGNNEVFSATILPNTQTGWMLVTFSVQHISPSLCHSKLYVNKNLESEIDIHENMANFLLSQPEDNVNVHITETDAIVSFDDFRIYNKALSADEVTQLYDEANPAGQNYSPTGQRYLISNY